MNKIRILVVDDHPLMRSALKNAIETEPDMEVVGEAFNGQQAVKLYQQFLPDMVLMDLFMPVMDGIEATRQIVQENPDSKILAITSLTEDEKVLAAVRAGAVGYILKDATQEKLVEGIRLVAGGKRFLPPEIVEKLARSIQNEGKQPGVLTKREKEVLILMGQGLTNSRIAEKLYLSNSTVRVHIYNILDKLGLSDRNQAVIYANNNQINIDT